MGEKLTSKNLPKLAFKAELPEKFIRELPAQALHLAVRTNGLASTPELIQIATVEQVRLMLDFDCWNKDTFNEDNFWEWLELTDSTDGLEILHKIFSASDLKLITLIIARYVDHEFYEEPTEAPPAPEYYTPDKGHTWINVNIEDTHKQFLLGRLLALIFETNPDLFYQLLTLSGTNTQSVLEEESYQDKTRRLNGEGIPDGELAHEINSPLLLEDILIELGKNPERNTVDDVQAVRPFVYDSRVLEPLASLIEEIDDVGQFEGEFTYLMNCALVHHNIPQYEQEKVQQLAEQLKEAINNGLQLCVDRSKKDSRTIYETLGLQKLYRLGLGHTS